MFCLPLSGLVPAGGEGGLLGYSLLGERVGFYGYFHGGAGFRLLPKRRKKNEKLYIYIYITTDKYYYYYIILIRKLSGLTPD